MALNDVHARAVTASFTHVSELLDGVQKLARNDLNPFDRQHLDLTPAEARRLETLAATIRASMLEALDALGIGVPQPDGSARWGARTALLFGDIALSELTGGELRGYGDMDPDDESRIASVVKDVRRLVARARELLRGIDPGAVEDAVGRVDGPVGEVLKKIWRFAQRNALVDVYAEVAAVAERAGAAASDIGVFGRANAGKSALVNALIGMDVLPVGALPVTAIPLRLERGPSALRVRHAGGADEELPLEELARFDLESLEAGETDIVGMDALVRTAPEGIRFIDTPGVGSFGTPAGARALDWLPRCDLGLLLVPAGSVPETVDVSLARGLRDAGVEVKVLLSKADLLPRSDLPAATQYVRGVLGKQLGEDVPEVLAVSVVDGGEALETLRREVLEPLAAGGERTQRTRLRGRLIHLIGSVEASFEARASDAREESALEEMAALRRAGEALVPGQGTGQRG